MSLESLAGDTVRAAGAIPWRIHEGELRVLVIHRTQHRDVSFPKGKVDAGESLPQTAVREIREETGLRVRLGVPLGNVSYAISGNRMKTVRYWATETTEDAVLSSTFVPNDEVAALEWLRPEDARRVLSYQTDIEILDVFLRYVELDALATFTLTVLRHGKALPRSESTGITDAQRPLVDRGRGQAEALVPSLAAYGPRRILTSTALRCLQTVEPLAERLGLRVRATDAISQDAWESGEAAVREVIGKRIRARKSAVICSHGPVLPEILHEIALATGTVETRQFSEAAELEVGEYCVVHLSRERPAMGVLAIERSAELR